MKIVVYNENSNSISSEFFMKMKHNSHNEFPSQTKAMTF